MSELPELTIGQQVRYIFEGTGVVNATVTRISKGDLTLYYIQPQSIGSVKPEEDLEFRSDLYTADETDRLINRLRWNARCAELSAGELERAKHKEPSAA